MAERRFRYAVIELHGGVLQAVTGCNDPTAARHLMVAVGRRLRSHEDDDVYLADLDPEASDGPGRGAGLSWYDAEVDTGAPFGDVLCGELVLAEIERDQYGGGAGHPEGHRAINVHSDRTYVDQLGRYWRLSRTLDGTPPFFEAYGPWTDSYSGVLPRLQVGGLDSWGGGSPWKGALVRFFFAAEAKAQEIENEKRAAPRDAEAGS